MGLVRGQINSNEYVRLRPHERAKGENVGEGKLRRSISSTKRSRGQKECPIIQGDLPGNSSDKDIRYKRTGQLGGGKYLRESCYHCIKYSAANPLAALMRK